MLQSHCAFIPHLAADIATCSLSRLEFGRKTCIHYFVDTLLPSRIGAICCAIDLPHEARITMCML